MHITALNAALSIALIKVDKEQTSLKEQTGLINSKQVSQNSHQLNTLNTSSNI